MDKKKEQVLAFLETLEIDPKEKRKIAKQFDVTLPVAELSEQLAASRVEQGHVPKKAKEGTIGKDYVVIPSLELSDGTQTRETWVRLEVAEEVGQRLIALAGKSQ